MSHPARLPSAAADVRAEILVYGGPTTAEWSLREHADTHSGARRGVSR